MRPTAFRSRLRVGFGQTERARRTGGARVREAEPGSAEVQPVPSSGTRCGVPRGTGGTTWALTSTPSAASRSWSSGSGSSVELASQRGSAGQGCASGPRRPRSATVRTVTQNGNGTQNGTGTQNGNGRPRVIGTRVPQGSAKATT